MNRAHAFYTQATLPRGEKTERRIFRLVRSLCSSVARGLVTAWRRLETFPSSAPSRHPSHRHGSRNPDGPESAHRSQPRLLLVRRSAKRRRRFREPGCLPPWRSFEARGLKVAFPSRGPADLLSRRLEVGFAMRTRRLDSARSQEGRAPLFVVTGAWFGRPSMPAPAWGNRF
jgi:hypothetical protein